MELKEKWTILTYFPYIRFPEHYPFLNPAVTQAAADTFGFNFNYRSELNWTKYERFMEFYPSIWQGARTGRPSTEAPGDYRYSELPLELRMDFRGEVSVGAQYHRVTTR
jgi:hypothetical protein